MKTVLLLAAGLLVLAIGAMALWRQADHRADRREVARLLALQPASPARFDRTMTEGLPAPVRRYFDFTIAEGTPLYTVARLTMEGQFGLGDKVSPNYMPMRATQTLAAPHGFVWQMSGGTAPMTVSGSDSGEWTRFWLAGLLPVARAGGTGDHRLSAFGRYTAEATFWTPAALLPGPGVTWEAPDENTARVTIRRDDLDQVIDIHLDPDGRPLQVIFQRWSNANPTGIWQRQPFGGSLSDFQPVAGFMLPLQFEAGNHFGTEDYFPFVTARITEIHFPPAP